MSEEETNDLAKLISSVLQTQASQQDAQLREIRTVMREDMAKVTASLARLHDRVDERLEKCHTTCHGRIEEIAESHESLSDEFHSWLNRGLGAWGVAVLLAGILGWFGTRWLDASAATSKEVAEAVAGLSAITKEHTARIQALHPKN